ncbi:MAG: response regulator transcription factor [Pseudomonadota bacterium]
MNILLVEDDEETASFICRGLREAGDAVTHLYDGRKGLLAATQAEYDTLVFDRLLPGMDGLDAVRVLRESHIETPIIMLTALAGIEDRVNGLEAGADDYLVKPFAFAELYARIRALCRRKPLLQEEHLLTVHDLTLDRTTQQVSRQGQLLELMPREYRILEYLMLNASQLVTRTMLLECVWGYNFDPKTSLVQTHVSRLRAKVDKPFDSDLIKTVRGSGYVLGSPDP